MALKDLASDLSNFKGQTSPKSIDNQIKNGVDFIPNDDASGFTPKTDLKSLYKKANSAVGATTYIPESDGQFSTKWSSNFPKDMPKTRKAYGENGEYQVGAMVGRALPLLINSEDNFGTPWSDEYGAIKDIANYVSLIRTSGFENSKLSLISIPKLFTPQEFETVGVSGPIDHSILSEKQRGVFNSYPVLEFEHRNKDNNIVGYSAHVSPGGEINAGLRYGAMTDQSFVKYEQGSALIDLAKKGAPKTVNIFPNLDIDSQYGSSFGSSTMDIPATGTDPAFRQTAYTSRTVYGNTVSSLSDLFRGDEMWSTSNKNKIDELIKFKDNNFIGIPTGLDQNMKIGAGTTDFRTVANTGPHKGGTHPLILRKIGTTWGSDEELQFQRTEGSRFNASTLFGGEDSLNTLNERTSVDRERIVKWQATPAGRIFIDKQYKLQFANPTIESKYYNLNSLTGVGSANVGLLNNNENIFGNYTTNPTLKDVMGFADTIKNTAVYHGQRHKELTLSFDVPQPLEVVGIAIPTQTVGIPGRYQTALKFTSGDGRLAYQAKAFSAPLSQWDMGITSNFSDGLLGGWLGGMLDDIVNGAVDKIQDTINSAAAAPKIALSNPNRYFGFGSTAPFTISNGVPSFTFNLLQSMFDTGKIINIKGGTFNRDTHKAADVNYSKTKNEFTTHHTLPYSSLSDEKGTFLYEKIKNLPQGKDVNRPSPPNDANLNAPWMERTDKLESMTSNAPPGMASLGNPGKKQTHPRKREDLGFVKLDGASTGLNSDQADKVNLIPYGLDYGAADTQDFIKFRFEDMVNNQFIIFRAILEGISDSITPEYNEERYIGRPDKVYTYQGADRNISFGFSIYPKTKQELPVLMEKLNYLVGLCYPSYTTSERMITPLINLTLGDMFNKAPGILNSLTVSVEDSTTWELDEGLQFPHYIKAQCEFRYIGNNVLAGKGKHYGLDWIPDGSKGSVPGTPANEDGTGGTPALNRFANPDDLGFPTRPKRSKFEYINYLDPTFKPAEEAQ